MALCLRFPTEQLCRDLGSVPRWAPAGPAYRLPWASEAALGTSGDNTGFFFQTQTLSEAGVNLGEAPHFTPAGTAEGDDITVTQPVAFLKSRLLDNSIQEVNCAKLRPQLLLP